MFTWELQTEKTDPNFQPLVFSANAIFPQTNLYECKFAWPEFQG